MSKDQELFDGMARTIADQQEAIERVRELHKEFAGNIPGDLELCDVCHDANGVPMYYPCPTIKALDGEQE